MTGRGTWALVLAALATRLEAQAARSPVIDTVLVEPGAVFDGSRDSLVWYQRLANAIHVTTRPWIVRRELLFAAGEPYDSARAAESARNLRTLGVFRFVEIDTFTLNGQLAARVRTGDGWSTKPQVSFRTAGSQGRYAIGFHEGNLLGTATQAAAFFRHTPDREILQFGFRNPHTFGTPVETSLEYEKLSDGERGAWLVESHHVPLAGRLVYGLGGEAGTTRLLQFRNGVLDSVFQRRLVVGRANVGWAPVADNHRYLRLFVSGQLRREDVVPDTVEGFPQRTVTGAIGAGAEYRHARFVVTDHYNAFAQQEDVDLSTMVRAEWRLTPAAWGYDQTGSGPALRAQTGGTWRRTLLRLEVEGHAILRGASVDSGSVWGAGTVVVRALPTQTLILYGRAGAQQQPIPGAEFDLGLGEGPRAFGAHAFTGTRTAWATIEHRIYLADDWMDLLGVGIAGFADYGGAWYEGDQRRFGGNVGLGLRLGASRAASGTMTRLDLAYRFGEGFTGSRWAVVLGRGVSF